MIRKRGRKGVCSAEFMIDGQTYQFTFNGKKDMPLITSKTEAREYEDELKRKVVSGLLLKQSDLKNFAKFFDDIYMDYSRKHKVPSAAYPVLRPGGGFQVWVARPGRPPPAW